MAHHGRARPDRRTSHTGMVQSRITLATRRPRPGDTHGVEQPQFDNLLAELAIIAVARIGQHYAECNASRMRGVQLVQCDLRLDLEDDVVRNLGLLPPVWIVRPGLGQLEPVQHLADGTLTCPSADVCDGQARMAVGNRQ
jgi:hypothetical protein